MADLITRPDSRPDSAPAASPESLADAIAHQLAAPGAAATRVPKWSDIAARTLRVYETVSEK